MSRYQAAQRNPFFGFATGFSVLVGATLVLSAVGLSVMIEHKRSDATRTAATGGEIVPTQTRWEDFGSGSGAWGGTSSAATVAPSADLAVSDAAGVTDFWRSTRRAPRSQRPSSQHGSYRTVCVRLCDGYFWPMSFTTSRGSFEADEKACASSCSAPTKLFYYANPGQTPEQMVDRRGRPYTNLRTAFQYRTSYNPSCTCDAQPWEQASRERHAMYAQLERDGQLQTYLAKLSRDVRRRNRSRSVVAWRGTQGGQATASRTTAQNRTQSNGTLPRVVRGVTAMGLGAGQRTQQVRRARREATRARQGRASNWQRSRSWRSGFLNGSER